MGCGLSRISLGFRHVYHVSTIQGAGFCNHPQYGTIFLQATFSYYLRWQVVQALCQLGANVKAVDEEGWTPLYVPWRNPVEGWGESACIRFS